MKMLQLEASQSQEQCNLKRRFDVEYTNLSVDEIRQQLAQIEQSKADLEIALERRRQEAKVEVAQQVRDLILHNGYEINEILPLISVRRRRGQAVKKAAASHQYARYADPQNPAHVYVRGVIPGWMKQRMQEQGYDPSSKQDREAFKANYLTALDS
jgi:DNA-binding protein H-NS